MSRRAYPAVETDVGEEPSESRYSVVRSIREKINEQMEHEVIFTCDHDDDSYEVALSDMGEGHWSGTWACGEKRGPVCGTLCRNPRTKKAILYVTWKEDNETFAVCSELREVEED